MDTRRIRRLERRHSRRIITATLAFGAIGIAIGLALPRSATASALVLVAAAATLALIALRADAVAPSHGLRYVVRLPFPEAAATSLDSFRSRLVGSARAAWQWKPSALPAVEEADDETEAWWGAQPEPEKTPALVPVSVILRDADPPPTPSRVALLRSWASQELTRVGTVARRVVPKRGAPDDAESDALEGGTLSTSS
jgi:hypothetical protein